MILLLGGTSESIEIARLLVDAGFSTLLSMATDMSMNLPESPLLTVRRGPLDQRGMEEVCLNNGIKMLVDATHPYAGDVTGNAILVCRKLHIEYLRLSRKPVVQEGRNIIFVKDHAVAALKAVSLGGTILATIGIRRLGVYVSMCSKYNVKLIVRALPSEDSRKMLCNLGVPPEDTIIGRGPFSFEDNLLAIRRFGVKTLVTKDSGIRGGTEQKVRAAEQEGCSIIVVQRPHAEVSEAFSEPLDLFNAVKDYFTTMSSNKEGVTSMTML
ncbi:MAG: precorrin-6A reductase [Deltaproteobacteria bacterium]|nr:precorrin-6A reductase [Deltaproteobacteria bacterium]